MANVYRIFVEKKKGNDIEAMQILTDLRQNVGITALTGLRLINRYDVQGVSEAEFRRAVHGVFAEDNLDNTADEVTFAPGERVFAMEFLPGQYDQRADSAAQCIQLLTAGECPRVASAKVIALAGDITDAEFDKIKSYLINPVESREATMAKPESLDLTADVPADIARIAGFIAESDDEIAAYHSQMGFAMSVEDLKWVRDYFKNEEHRDPSLTELKVIDTYWSDHCRHTTFSTKLDKITVDYYGAPTPLNQVAAISSPDPRSLMIQPWDSTLLKAIEKAIQTSDLGINPQNDGKVIRLAFPQLTEERRKELTKQVKKYGENGKVAIRNIRRDAMEKFKSMEKKSEITEDDRKDYEKELQDMTEKRCKQIDELTAKKEAELMAV